MNILKVCALVVFALFLFGSQVRADSHSFNPYMNFGLGGNFAGGDAYDDYDPRFILQLEAGGQYFALPVSGSFGDDFIIVGFKPRLQYFYDIGELNASLDGLRIAPFVGPVINYWNGDTSIFGVTIDLDMLELGMQVGAVLHYDVVNDFHVFFSPIGMDFLFYRKLWVSGAGSTVSDSNSELGFVYNVLAGVGYNF